MTAGILLAAGQSSRFGKSKQLALFRGVPLLRHAAQMLIDAAFAPCIVVLSNTDQQMLDQHCAVLDDFEVEIAINSLPTEGLSNSIRAGLHAALRVAPQTSHVVLTVCDQPLCTAAHLQSLVATATVTGSEIVASGYSGISGVPACFASSLFPELASLTGDRGAGQLIRRHADLATVVPFPGGEADIDTLEDLTRLC